MKRWFVYFSPVYVKTLVYMLQSTEYQPVVYLGWWWRTRDFSSVTRRGGLDLTRPARLLLGALNAGIVVYLGCAIWLIVSGWFIGGIILIVLYPVIWAHLLVLPVWIGRLVLVDPARARTIAASEKIFARESKKSVIIAVTGSYGKTSMKELLTTVLSTQLNVAATPANFNVPTSHARFAQTLSGEEDIVVIEYGEGAPGDVDRFAQTTHPSHAIITGIAPAHLDRYRTIEAAAKDIFSVTDYVAKEKTYINTDSSLVEKFAKSGLQQYNHKQALGWKIHSIRVAIDGVNFSMHRGAVTMKIQSGLLGRHNVGPLACVAALAYDFGLSVPQIEEAISNTRPHEHRMQPYRLGGAWVIDDTYNGNIEGIRVGTALLAELPATRKIYITPGLVDQGGETESVHIEMGKLIAEAKPNLVVLMCNSVTTHILEGLTGAGFDGDVQIQDDPLDFYTNLSHFVATGDLVMMQNDWTDNYH